MLKSLGKYIFMIEHGYRFIKIFKKIYTHPFMTPNRKTTLLSKQRQNYSNLVLDFLNLEIKIYGEIPEQNKILYAINHRSLLDIIVIEHIMSQHDKNGVWIAKQELSDAFYGDFFTYSGCISVDLENKRGLLSFFKEIKHLISRVENLNIYIFPEGERHKGSGITSFQAGATKIAKANKLDVVPVYINDTLEKVFQASPFKERQTVEVHFAKPVHADELEEKYIAFKKEIESE